MTTSQDRPDNRNKTSPLINNKGGYPLHIFRFYVEFVETSLLPTAKKPSDIVLCDGAFSECSGLEATMEPKVIQAGGQNFGAYQRSGPVTFSTVILRRGITLKQHLWDWFNFVTLGSKYSFRLDTKITLFDPDLKGILSWELKRALPIRFRGPDLNSTGREVGIEELHLAHEGLSVWDPSKPRPETP